LRLCHAHQVRAWQRRLGMAASQERNPTPSGCHPHTRTRLRGTVAQNKCVTGARKPRLGSARTESGLRPPAEVNTWGSCDDLAVAAATNNGQPTSGQQTCGEAQHDKTRSSRHRQAARRWARSFVTGNFKSGIVRGRC